MPRTSPGDPRGELYPTNAGYVRRHPYDPGFAIMVTLSDRGRPGEFDPDIWNEGLYILDAVIPNPRYP